MNILERLPFLNVQTAQGRLDELLDDGQRREFLEAWGKEPCVFRLGEAAVQRVFRRPIDMEYVDHLIENAEHCVDASFDTFLSPAEGHPHHRLPTDLHTARRLMRRGAPFGLNVFGLHQLSPEIAEAIFSFRRALRTPYRAESVMFWTGGPARTAPHFDTGTTIQFQLIGRKRWTVSESPLVAWPEEARYIDENGLIDVTGPDLELQHVDPASLKAQQFEVGPGDVVCFPAGTVHATESEDHSLALTLAFFHTSVRDAYAKAASASMTDEPWIHPFGAPTLENASSMSPAAPSEEQWLELFASLWAESSFSKINLQQGPLPEPDSTIRVCPQGDLAYLTTADEVLAYFGDTRFSVAKEQLPVLNLLAKRAWTPVRACIEAGGGDTRATMNMLCDLRSCNVLVVE